MLFRRQATFRSKQSPDNLRTKIKGEHLKIHDLDFEIMEKEGILKIIPHTEYAEEKIYTLPITHVTFEDDGSGGSKVRMKSKPRRIDIGGPNLVMVFSLFIFLAGLGLYVFMQDEGYDVASKILMGIGGLILIFFWYRMSVGYFDYIRKQKKWLKSHI
jgi:hypothetical protein